MKLTREKIEKIISEAVDETTALTSPVDAVVTKRMKLDDIKSRMRSVVQTLDITVDGLKDDVPRIGGKGVTMRDLHGAVIALTQNSSMLLDLLDELEGLREGAVRSSRLTEELDKGEWKYHFDGSHTYYMHQSGEVRLYLSPRDRKWLVQDMSGGVWQSIGSWRWDTEEEAAAEAKKLMRRMSHFRHARIRSRMQQNGGSDVTESWQRGPDLMAMTAEELRSLQQQTEDSELKDVIEAELQMRKKLHAAGGLRGAR